MPVEGLLNFSRGYALTLCLLVWFTYSVGTKWWRSLGLSAIWCLFSGFTAVLLLANGIGHEWFAKVDVLTLTAYIWLFVGTLFLIFLVSFIAEQFRKRPNLLDERERHRNKPSNRV